MAIGNTDKAEILRGELGTTILRRLLEKAEEQGCTIAHFHRLAISQGHDAFEEMARVIKNLIPETKVENALGD